MRFYLFAFAAFTLLACSSTESGDAGANGSSSGGGEPATGGAGGDSVPGGAAGAGGGTGGDGGGGRVCQGPAWPANPACEACEKEKCCITGANCAADSECMAIMECAVEGGDGCTMGHAGGIWNYSGLVVCLQNACASECAIEAATCGGIQPTPESCTEEVYAACCEETTACGQSDACVALIYQCIDENQCASQDCYEECLALYPDGKEPFETMAACWGDVPCL